LRLQSLPDRGLAGLGWPLPVEPGSRVSGDRRLACDLPRAFRTADLRL